LGLSIPFLALGRQPGRPLFLCRLDFAGISRSNAQAVQSLNTAMLTDEFRYRILKILQNNPAASQREIARELGISLGRVNFCLQALIEKGLIKVNNFRENEAKRAYLYLLTPKGIQEKARVTVRFLKVKLDEYESLKREVAQLQREAGGIGHEIRGRNGK
jgi:EPS-associated MarR family transcriptional regulator